jgi:hypothetical protein
MAAVMATTTIIVTTDMGMATMATSSIGAITTTGGTITTTGDIITMTGIIARSDGSAHPGLSFGAGVLHAQPVKEKGP